jgi:glycosyltransferase involved in cell wall biosynthesis
VAIRAAQHRRRGEDVSHSQPVAIDGIAEVERSSVRSKSLGRPRLCFVVESGTDVRLVDGLAERTHLIVVARRIEGGVEISQPSRACFDVIVGPASFQRFARFVYSWLRPRARRFDFVLIQGYGAAAAAANLAVRRTPSAMLVCSSIEAYYSCRKGQDGFGKPYRRRELTVVRMLAALNARLNGRYIVLSKHLEEVVRSHGATRRVDVIPLYGVDTQVFRPCDRPRDQLRRARALPDTGSIVFFSSRIAPEKDSDTLLRAFRCLRDEGRDVHLLHRSGGFERFRSEAQKYGVDDRVIATAAVHPHEELPLDYLASDVCVQASRAEGLGYSVLEAMACGVPVVASRVGGLAETVVDGLTGWSCPPGDPDALHAALCEALDNPAEARRRAAAGAQMVRERFDRARVFDRFMDLVEHARD